MVLQHQEVSYDDASHRYYVQDETYTSATQLVDQFKNKFKTKEMSEWMAFRYGNTPEYWITKWKKDNGDSLERGNSIHDYEEKKLLKKGYDLLPYPVPVQEHKPAIHYGLPDGVYPELKLWRHDCKIAGRVDKAILVTPPFQTSPSNRTAPRFMDIDDHKTNRKIRTESFNDPETGKPVMMLGPMAHLMDCELNHYTLQLSIYQYMGEYHGFRPGWRRIIHHRHMVPGVADNGPKIIELPYLRDEVIAMINYKHGS